MMKNLKELKKLATWKVILGIILTIMGILAAAFAGGILIAVMPSMKSSADKFKILAVSITLFGLVSLFGMSYVVDGLWTKHLLKKHEKEKTMQHNNEKSKLKDTQ